MRKGAEVLLKKQILYAPRIFFLPGFNYLGYYAHVSFPFNIVEFKPKKANTLCLMLWALTVPCFDLPQPEFPSGLLEDFDLILINIHV